MWPSCLTLRFSAALPETSDRDKVWQQTPGCLPLSSRQSIRIWSGWQTTTGENTGLEKTGVRSLFARVCTQRLRQSPKRGGRWPYSRLVVTVSYTDLRGFWGDVGLSGEGIVSENPVELSGIPWGPAEKVCKLFARLYRTEDRSGHVLTTSRLLVQVQPGPPTPTLAPGPEVNGSSGELGEPRGRLDRVRQAHRLLEPVLRVPVGDNPGYSPAWMTTRPPSRTWMFRSCPSRSSMPTSGVLPVAAVLIRLGWPSHRTVTW